MLPEHTEKNKPRDTYIVEDMVEKNSQNHSLIRKINRQIRSGFYKALPEEPILLPGLQTGEDETFVWSANHKSKIKLKP